MDILDNKANRSAIKRFSIEEKLMIVEQLKTKTARDISHIYNVHERTVRKWKSHFDNSQKNRKIIRILPKPQQQKPQQPQQQPQKPPQKQQSQQPVHVQGTIRINTDEISIIKDTTQDIDILKINTDEIDIIKIESAASALDKELYEWCLDRKSKGLPISKSMIKETALILNEELGGDLHFIASEYWFSSWQRRMNIECLE